MIGHEIQRHYGTEVLSFRLINSFHMPLFMFLSGMVFSLKLHGFPSQSLNISREIIKPLRGLLLPFICWTIINAFLNRPDSMPGYFWKVIKSPEFSLWFLIALCWCRIFFVMIYGLHAKFFSKPSVISLAAFTALVYFPPLLFIPFDFGFMGIGLFRMYFPFFTAGIFLYQFRERLSALPDNIPLNIAVLLLFAVTAPCWYVTVPNPFASWLNENFWHGAALFKILKKVPAIPGIFLMMSLTKIIFRMNFKPLIKSLAFTGQFTLGIYAIHFYFLGMFPPVILPLSASIILTMIIGKIPAVRSLLLGK